jgi:curved DNA-binding protein CbpA
MDTPRNLYLILHVQPDAPEEIIRSSYRTLMTKLRRHPDLGGDHHTATLINEAYAVLCDPAKRAAYDEAWRSVAVNPVPASRTAPDTPARSPFSTCQFCGTAHGFADRIHTSVTCATCNTPLAPAVRERLDTGQRAVSRMPRQLALKYFTGWPGEGPFHGEARDLSLHGLRFVTQAALPVTKLLKVDCEAVNALVRVVACSGLDEGDWRWLIRAEYVTVSFRRARGGFVTTKV